jgi:hypothetical protein
MSMEKKNTTLKRAFAKAISSGFVCLGIILVSTLFVAIGLGWLSIGIHHMFQASVSDSLGGDFAVAVIFASIGVILFSTIQTSSLNSIDFEATKEEALERLNPLNQVKSGIENHPMSSLTGAAILGLVVALFNSKPR